MEKLQEIKDFRTSEYYKFYSDMVNEYCVKTIKSIVESQWIDNEVKYTRWDVLKELLKFLNWDLREFKDLDITNPSRVYIEEKEMKEDVERQAKQLLGIQ